ncbi:hypothetical protein FIU89_07420 [Roseovarius sp. THAF27]|uniref:hypothetical protein n=1 Tax=Roseovarius TaxID=74030 RepID=UPI001268A687|nr:MULTISPECIES: hypothetical protein [Roseovarius]MBY5988248.1 hypothetical protein [Roseovarius atlanticus]MBY6123639.1 hypothetical protein [Roseovarius atlanticus]MBY6148134.1 hypothetical protein [Roseovarius atlanticus]QFT80435.1 hypothetical protein FIU89_07420 [Roseovarius sp. THAF27]
MSTTAVETWAGADLSQIGPIYPMVGTEMILVIVGVLFWLGFHVLQARIERRELDGDEAAARSPERIKRVFEEEARE